MLFVILHVIGLIGRTSQWNHHNIMTIKNALRIPHLRSDPRAFAWGWSLLSPLINGIDIGCPAILFDLLVPLQTDRSTFA